MRIVGVIAVAVLLMSLLSCGASSIPSSSILFRNAATNALLSTPAAQGVLIINAGSTAQIKIERTWRNQAGNTLTDDVTQFTNFVFTSGVGFATIDQLGNVNAIAPGIAVLEAKFRDSGFDPWDRCYLTIEVI